MTLPDAVMNAWRSGERTEVAEALDAWQAQLAAGAPASALAGEPLELLLQRVQADSMFESGLLAATVREAERRASAAGDEIALARIGAAVIDALYSDWLPSREARRWLDVLRGVSFTRITALALPERLTIAVGILAADLFGESLASARPVADSVLEWCQESQATPATWRGNALGYALEYFSGLRDWSAAVGVVAEIDRLQAEPGFGPVARARVAARRGFYFHYRRGDYAGALGQSIAAVDDARAGGVQRAAREAGITVTLCHLMRGELAAADRALRAEMASIPDGHLMMRANVHYERAWWHGLRRDVVSAQQELDTACRLFAEIDEHGVMSLATPSLQAQLLLQVGEHAAALRVFEMRSRRPDAWLVDMAMITALAALTAGDLPKTLAALRQALPIAARIDIKGCLWACRDELTQLLKLAIAHGVEADWARAAAAARLLELG